MMLLTQHPPVWHKFFFNKSWKLNICSKKNLHIRKNKNRSKYHLHDLKKKLKILTCCSTSAGTQNLKLFTDALFSVAFSRKFFIVYLIIIQLILTISNAILKSHAQSPAPASKVAILPFQKILKHGRILWFIRLYPLKFSN